MSEPLRFDINVRSLEGARRAYRLLGWRSPEDYFLWGFLVGFSFAAAISVTVVLLR
jgi:hypothetical protein